MRVNISRRDERGAVLIIVAAFVIVAAIFLAFVIDIGNQRQDRRQLTTATDASALDVAQEWIETGEFSATYFPGNDCSSRAYDYLNRNREVDSSYDCDVSRVSGQLGAVTVQSDGTTEYEIAQVIGQSQGQVASTSSVRVEPLEGGGLRPFAICAKDSLALRAWLLAPIAPIDLIIGGPKSLSPSCDPNNGNWGFVAFSQEGINGFDGLRKTLDHGTTQGTYSLDRSPNPGDPETECEDAYYDTRPDACLLRLPGSSGWAASTEAVFQRLKDDQVIFNLPIYDNIVDLGGGKTGFPIEGFIEVRLLSFCGDNSYTPEALLMIDAGACKNQSGQQVDNFLHLELRAVSTGDCCNINPDNYQLQICDVGTTGGAVLSSFTTACLTGGGHSGGGPSLPELECEVTGPDVGSPNYNAAKDELSKDFAFTSGLLNEALCGTITAELEGPSATVPIPVSRSGSQIGGTLAKTDGIWEKGLFRLRVFDNGQERAIAEFTLK